MRFVEEAANVLLIGPPGVDKTMLALCLGHAAVDAGYWAYYTTAADLAARCHRAALEGRWATTMRFFAGPRLLIVDEVGYLPMPAESAAALFQVVSQRYLKGSICLTTNRSISSWGQIFADPMVAAAMLDRLLHRSTVLQIEGESYRMRAHRARAEKLRRGVRGWRLNSSAREPRIRQCGGVSLPGLPDDWPTSADPCPICGGDVKVVLVGGVTVGGEEQWNQAGECLECRTQLRRRVTDIDRPVRDMRPTGPWERT